MSSKRETTPPGKPTVSRLSLGKIKGKQGSSGSIAIRFNAASLDEDDYDLNDDLSIGSSGSGRPRGDSVKFEIRKDDSKVYSQSAPASEVSSPVSAGSSLSSKPSTNSKLINDCTFSPTETSEHATLPTGEKSILSGIKEKLHDKLPEPINAFIEKIEVLTDSSPEDVKKKIHKSESQDSESSVKLSQSDSSDKISVRKSESMESTRSVQDLSSSKNSSLDIMNRNRSRTGSTESEISESGYTANSESMFRTDSCFEVLEDYFDDDTFNEPSVKSKHSMASVGKSSSTEPLTTKQRSSSLRKLIGQKDRSASPARGIKTAMTLSGLLSSKSDDSIHSHTTTMSDQTTAREKSETEQFYDIENIDAISESSFGRSPLKDNVKMKPISPINPSETRVVVSNPRHKYILVAVFAALSLIIPLPSFVSGLVLGAAAMYSVLQLYEWLCAPPKPREPFILPDLDKLSPLLVPEMKESRNIDGKFQVWMNELQSYHPDDYHINLTASVYVTLEGTTLRLQRPKVNVSKRAMWDEPAHSPTFIHQRHFDLKGSRVFLEPAGLVRKRLWSKKYPICIALSKDTIKGSSEITSVLFDPEKENSHGEEGCSDRGKKLVTQVSLDEEKIRHSEKKERKLVVQMSLDERKLEMNSENSEHKHSDAEIKDTSDKSSESKNVSEDGYEVISKEECDTKILYLFARTGREKEEWYRRFVAASSGHPWPTKMSDLLFKLSEATTGSVQSTIPSPESQSPPLRKRHSSSSLESLPSKHHQRQGSADSATISICETSPVHDSPKTIITQPQLDADTNNQERVLIEYLKYMSLVLPAIKTGESSRVSSPLGISPGRRNPEARERCEPYCVWVNTLVSRCFWDFLREAYWADYMKQKIQRKLSKIHVPFFIDELTVTDIMLGCEMPVIRRISRPYMDDRGLWIDMDVTYNGGFQMSLETKVNLMKLKKEKLNLRSQSRKLSNKRSAVLNEDEEDSAESSTDEEAEVTTYVATNEMETSGGSTGKKLLRLVDKLTQNKYFQQATENKFVKRAMEGVSNTPLMLNVELKSLIGTLAVNVPPPPTDRVWYGFRTNPKLWLSAKPKVGERQVTVTHVTEWIEKKLSVEFQRVFVMPNMDDLPIPLMCDHLPDNPPTFETAL